MWTHINIVCVDHFLLYVTDGRLVRDGRRRRDRLPTLDEGDDFIRLPA